MRGAPAAKIVGVASASLGDFDMAALYAALDKQRRARGLTWAGATREINRPAARPVLHPISVSSVTGTRNGRGTEGNIVLQLLGGGRCTGQAGGPPSGADTDAG
jgi:hypothetical protein